MNDPDSQRKDGSVLNGITLIHYIISSTFLEKNRDKIFDKFEGGSENNFDVEPEAGAPDIFCIPIKTG